MRSYLDELRFDRIIKIVPYSITSVGHGADPGFLVISPQVTLVINPLLSTRPAVTFLAKEIIFLANTKLYCLITEALRCQ